MIFLNSKRQWAGQLKIETYALYLAYKDPRVPWYARLLAIIVASYAFSPIDLIPDFIPVLGYLDDLLLIPLGVVLVFKIIPPQVLVDCRRQARRMVAQNRLTGWITAALIVVIWLLLAGTVTVWLIKAFQV